MILTKDVTTGRGKKQTTTKGTKTLATEFFATLTPKQTLLNATVHLSTATGNASGVILGVNKDDTTAYVLTARHCLFTLAGKKSPEDKQPNQYPLTGYANGIKIKYGPFERDELYKTPAGGPALVSAINFASTDNTSWQYDIVIFESTNEAFITFAKANRFIKSQEDVDNYGTILRPKSGSLPLLNKRDYNFIQLGYGANIDPDWRTKRMDISAYDTTDPTGKIQCKESVPEATTTMPGSVFNVDRNTRPDKWLTYINTCQMTADRTNSTGPGDSGGPLFSVSRRTPASFFLVGLTTGANFFSDTSYKTDPSLAPSDIDYRNNVVTYWDTLYYSFDWTTFFEPEN
jgi:hypothetical protein